MVKCKIEGFDKSIETEDFIAVVVVDGVVQIVYNTDALTAGIAVNMTAAVFDELMAQCSEKDQKEILSIVAKGEADE